jgi:hypothetical protein
VRRGLVGETAAGRPLTPTMTMSGERLCDAGLCTKCGVREPEPLMKLCVRCLAYNANYNCFGYGMGPNLARGSEW